MKSLAIAAVVFCALAQVSEAALIGTELGFQVIYQETSTSQPIEVTSINTVTVGEPGVEVPHTNVVPVINPIGIPLVDLSINAGNDFIELGFANSAPFSLFAPAFRDSIVFTFDSVAKPTITSATIDPVTTLGLIPSDITFVGNKLEINTGRGLAFDPSTIVRIDLTSTSPVPLPAAVWLFGAGLVSLGAVANRKRA